MAHSVTQAPSILGAPQSSKSLESSQFHYKLGTKNGESPTGGGPSLELPRICQQSLARTQSHGPTYLLGMWSSCALEKTENSFTVISLWHKLHVISPLIPDLCCISVTSNANRFFVVVIILTLLQSALPPSNSQISRTVTKNSKEKKTFGLPRYTSHIDQLVDPGLQPHLQPQCRWGLQKCE